MTKASCFSLPLKTTEEDNEEEKPTASPAAANEMSLDAAVAAFLSVLKKRRSCSTPEWLSKILVKHSCALLLMRGQRPAMIITPQAAASWLHWL